MNNIIGHSKEIDNLKHIISSNQIGHAYLFCGIEGIGKFQVAKEFAKAILCDNTINGDYCNSCESCLLRRNFA